MNTAKKLSIAVIMGGYSSEREISLQSGKQVLQHLDKKKYDVYGMDITVDKWRCWQGEEEYSVDRKTFEISKGGERKQIDFVINMIHGTPGEDGRILGYLDMLDIPYSSCGYYQAAVTFNKRDCIAIVRPWGIAIGKHVYINEGEKIDTAAIVEKVGLPLFVKANKSGSSQGVTKVYEEHELTAALEHAYEFDNEAIIESFLEGMEVSVGVLEYKDGLVALPPTEIRSMNDFFDYEAKYHGKAEEITPANLPDSEIEKLQQQAKRVYSVLKLKGIARVDYIYHKGVPHFIEVNTVPGMSPESIIPKQLRAAKLELKDILSFQIEKYGRR